MPFAEILLLLTVVDDVVSTVLKRAVSMCRGTDCVRLDRCCWLRLAVELAADASVVFVDAISLLWWFLCES